MFLTLSWSLFMAPVRSEKFPNETLPPNHAIFFCFLIPNRNLSKSDYPNTSIKKPCIHFHSQFKIFNNKPKKKEKGSAELKGDRFDHQASIASFTSLRSDFGGEDLRWRSTVENWNWWESNQRCLHSFLFFWASFFCFLFFLMGRVGLNLGIFFLGQMGLNGFLFKTQ